MGGAGFGTARRSRQSRTYWEKYLSRFPVGLGYPPEPSKVSMRWRTLTSPWLPEQFLGRASPEKNSPSHEPPRPCAVSSHMTSRPGSSSISLLPHHGILTAASGPHSNRDTLRLSPSSKGIQSGGRL